MLQSLNIAFIIANSADPDGMQHYAAFHLGLHCLPNYPLYIQKVNSLLSGEFNQNVPLGPKVACPVGHMFYIGLYIGKKSSFPKPIWPRALILCL